MSLTCDDNKTMLERVERDPVFAKALLDEAAKLFLSDLVNATVGLDVCVMDVAWNLRPSWSESVVYMPNHPLALD